jgi:hypothetical protein
VAQNPNAYNLAKANKQEPAESNFIRAQFRVQCKKWLYSNFGDYIEFEMVIQSLEGSRRTWTISKRYTDFVNLHEALTPYFRIQI